MSNNSNINIHCDGACLNNGHPNAMGGYGIVVEKDGQVQKEMFGKLRKGTQTNNRAELEALIQALEYILVTHCKSVTIYSDSKTIVDGVLGESQRKCNRDLWEIVEDIISNKLNDVDISMYHVDKTNINKESNIYKFNLRADALAFKGANALIINRR